MSACIRRDLTEIPNQSCLDRVRSPFSIFYTSFRVDLEAHRLVALGEMSETAFMIVNLLQSVLVRLISLSESW